MIRLVDESLIHTLTCERLAHDIFKRTGGRVRSLHVDYVDGRVIVSGEVRSYYVGQLAISAALELLMPHGLRLDWQMRVSTAAASVRF